MIYERAAVFAWTGDDVRESVPGVLDRRVRGSRGGMRVRGWTVWTGIGDDVWEWEDRLVCEEPL